MKYVCCSIVIDDCDLADEDLEAILNLEVVGGYNPKNARQHPIQIRDSYYPKQKIIRITKPEYVMSVYQWLTKEHFG